MRYSHLSFVMIYNGAGVFCDDTEQSGVVEVTSGDPTGKLTVPNSCMS